MWMPFIVAAAIGAWLLHGQPHAGEGRHAVLRRRRCSHGQTWIMSILYIGTFGSFIGYSFALPLVIKNTFPEFLAEHPFIATYLAGLGFVGALIGSVARPLGGWLSDRVGGARVTLVVLRRHGRCSPLLAIAGVQRAQLRRCSSASYMVIFLLAGHGQRLDLPDDPVDLRRARPQRGRRARARPEGDGGRVQAPGGGGDRHRRRDRRVRRLPDPGRASARRASASSALVKAAETPAEKLAVAQAHADWSIPALWVFLGAYVVFAGDDVVLLPAHVASRRDRVPSLAHAAV